MANRRYIDFPIASSVGDSDIILIWQSGANKQTTKATFLSGLPENLDELNDVAISGLTNGQILRYDSVTGKWENTDQGNLDLNDLNDVSIVSPSNGQVLVYNSSTSRWENSSGGYVPYTGAVTTVNLGAQTIQAGSFVKAGGTSAQFLKANGSVDSTAYGTGSVTSVALTMPSAFSVANSPVTTAGTLAVTGAGTVGQYIRGDGSLADFPESSGGGSSVSYYLNGSVAQGTIGGVAYKELNKVPILGAGTDFTINANGYIASFITDAGDPNLLEIPAGNWNFETFFSASSGGGSPTFYVELYKVNSGGTATLIASNSTFPELIAFGTNVISYFSTLAVPTTALALTDRLAIRYYVIHSGRTITLHTEDNHLCQIITTFTTGLTALNGLTAQIQNFAVGTSGTDFAISSATATHTFNLPTASATNRGALSSADWTTFNNKTSNLGTVTSVGLSSATSGVTIGSTPVTTSGTITLSIATASGSQNGLLSSTDWTTFNSKQNALTNPVTGTGTTNYLPKFTGSTTIGNSSITDVDNTAIVITKNGSSTSNPILSIVPSTTSNASILNLDNLGAGSFYLGRSSSSGGNPLISVGAFDSVIGHTGTQNFNIVTSSLVRILVDGATGLSTFTSTSGNGITIVTNDVATIKMKSSTGGTKSWGFATTNLLANDFGIYQSTAGGGDPISAGSPILYFNGTGAATFSSSVQTGGDISLMNSSGDISLKMKDSSGNADRVLTRQATTNDVYLGDIDANGGKAIIRANGENYLTITSGGNVLIGTITDNGARLQVSGTATISSTLTANGNIFLANDGTYGSNYITLGLGGISNGSNRIFAGTSSGVDGIFIAAATGRPISFRAGGGTTDHLIIASTGAATFSSSVETVARFSSSGDSTIIIGGNAAQGISSGEQYITYQNGTTNSNAWMVGMDDGEDWRFAYGAVGEITDANSLIKITQSGNVLIGTTTDAGYKLDVNGTSILRGTSIVTSAGGYSTGLVIQNTNNSSNNFSVLTLQANTDGYPIVEFKEGATQKWQIFNDWDNDSLNFYKWVGTAGSVLSLASTGAATFSSTIETTGIKFPATQVASADANTLDDYEEGTWTPTVTAESGSYTTIFSPRGTYTKIGRVVTLTYYFEVNNKGTGSNACILSSLPFASKSSSSGDTYVGSGIQNSSNNPNQIVLAQNSSSLYIYENTGDPITATLPNTGTITYIT
jgi:hypothetical protein